MPFDSEGNWIHPSQKDADKSASVRRMNESDRFYRGCFIGLIIGALLAVGASVMLIRSTVGNEEFVARKRARGEERARDIEEFFKKGKEYTRESEREVEKAEGSFLKNAKPADKGLYAAWMRDWLLQGNRLDPIWSFRDNFGGKPFYQITDGAVITPLYGANSVLIIAPKGTDFVIEATGHNEVFYWDESGNAKWEGWGDPRPILTPDIQARLEKMNDPRLNEVLKENLARPRR
jgi:hypothetical protein